MATKRDALVRRFVNKTTGSSRAGQKFNVVTKGGVRYHDYGGGRLIADKAGPSKPAGQQGIGTPATATSPPVGFGRPSWQTPGSPVASAKTPTNIGPPSPGAPHKLPPAGVTTDKAKLRALMKKAGVPSGLNAAARDRGPGRLNVTEASPRYGERFSIVKQGGTRYHKYGPGRKFADKKRGSGSVSTKPTY